MRRDLETELMSVQDQVQDGTPRSTILAELQRSSVERLPCLKHVAADSWTSAGTTMYHKPTISNIHIAQIIEAIAIIIVVRALMIQIGSYYSL